MFFIWDAFFYDTFCLFSCYCMYLLTIDLHIFKCFLFNLLFILNHMQSIVYQMVIYAVFSRCLDDLYKVNCKLRKAFSEKPFQIWTYLMLFLFSSLFYCVIVYVSLWPVLICLHFCSVGSSTVWRGSNAIREINWC